ncbi:mRNA export protein mlo3 [Trichoderma asperellum]|uniref:mRNA export protein mlo3 n=1 Tax=Trichoderma asperellum TaxID=101201 RepID=A0A6V8QW00_TRIAP|nr:mRNA export protein mlo3 [Trichoderma asperellum]
MSTKLDKPLDEIVTAQRRNSVRRRSLRRTTTGRPPATAPAGGVQKTAARANRGAAAKATPAKAAIAHGDSKVIVSNLPKDVTEKQIKEYFVQSVGPIKRVELSYGPNSQSRGIANVTFSKPDGASRALQSLNGLLVDGRPIKIEIVVGAAQADKVIPPVKSLAERATQPKSQPRSAAGKKQNAAATKATGAKGAAAANANKKRRGRNARPAKKTAEELDSDMADYFVNANNNDAAGGAAPAAAPANGDAPMEDEIMRQ